MVDRRHPVAGPAGALRASKIAPGDFVVAALLAMTSYFLTKLLRCARNDIGSICRFCDAKRAVSIKHVIAHIDHICQTIGNANHVGIGSDLDGGFGFEDIPFELDTASDLNLIAKGLVEYGYEPKDVEKIMGANWLRVLGSSLPA